MVGTIEIFRSELVFLYVFEFIILLEHRWETRHMSK